jgi:hypothetical protein
MHAPMNIDRFWEIIDLSRREFKPDRVDGNMERQRQEFESLLSELSPGEVAAFDKQLMDQMNAAYRWDLWGAAHIIAGGCSDAGFVDFRGWLISMGRRVFESAIEDVESLTDVADGPGIEDVFFEGFINVPEQVYEQFTGSEIPENTGHSSGEPAGYRWNSERDLQQRFPKLWAKYRSGKEHA